LQSDVQSANRLRIAARRRDRFSSHGTHAKVVTVINDG
jgi:hypothetical protein